jgi:hypothetical protein
MQKFIRRRVTGRKLRGGRIRKNKKSSSKSKSSSSSSSKSKVTIQRIFEDIGVLLVDELHSGKSEKIIVNNVAAILKSFMGGLFTLDSKVIQKEVKKNDADAFILTLDIKRILRKVKKHSTDQKGGSSTSRRSRRRSRERLSRWENAESVIRASVGASSVVRDARRAHAEGPAALCAFVTVGIAVVWLYATMTSGWSERDHLELGRTIDSWTIIFNGISSMLGDD